MPKSAAQLVSEYKRIYAAADEEGRDLTPSERDEVASLVEAAQQQKGIEVAVRELDPGAPGSAFTDPSRNGGGGPGDVFVGSAAYKMIKASELRPERWSSGAVEVMEPPALMAKGTLFETTSPAGGQALVPPAYQPGVVSKLFEPLGVQDVFGQSTVTSREVRYAVEGTATSAAGGVAEGGQKPESTLGYTETTEPIKKIAHFLPVSEEFLEDAEAIRGYLNERMSLFVRIEEERQLLRGTGTNELIGVFGRGGINQFTRAAADSNIETIGKVIANTAGSSFLYPDAVIMHPQNYLAARMTRAGTAGEFLGGGPWGPAYGGNSTLVGDNMWGTRVVLSSVVGLGTALVGNFGQGAHIWRRGGVSVEASNSHDQYFRLNLVALRAESRLGLGLYRPSAVTEVRGLTS